MKRNVALLWADTLESGEFQQGMGQLRTRVYVFADDVPPGEEDPEDAVEVRYQHCCLGVLCELARRAGVGEWDRDFASDGVDHGELHTFQGEANYLPADVVEWAGMNNQVNPQDPEVFGCTCVHDDQPDEHVAECVFAGCTLSDLNDGGDWNFQRIAGLVRERWADL